MKTLTRFASFALFSSLLCVPALAGAKEVQVTQNTIHVLNIEESTDDGCSSSYIQASGVEATSLENGGPPVESLDADVEGYGFDCEAQTGYFFNSEDSDATVTLLEFGTHESTATLKATVSVYLCTYTLVPEFMQDCDFEDATIDVSAQAVSPAETTKFHENEKSPNGVHSNVHFSSTSREAEASGTVTIDDLGLTVGEGDEPSATIFSETVKTVTLLP